MVQATRHTPRPAGSTDSSPRPASPARSATASAASPDSAILRLLARLSGAEIRAPGAASADRLAEWTRWKDAISLSEALSGSTGVAVRGSGFDGAKVAGCVALDAERARLRTELATAVIGSDSGAWRRGYQARQQAMEDGVAALRARARTKLALASPALAQLAAVDAVMERVLQPYEQALLATLPALLEKRFGPSQPEAGAEREIFDRELHELLRAELDFRMQAVEGLLEALRGSHKT